jgi:hypothetical protein
MEGKCGWCGWECRRGNEGGTSEFSMPMPIPMPIATRAARVGLSRPGRKLSPESSGI